MSHLLFFVFHLSSFSFSFSLFRSLARSFVLYFFRDLISLLRIALAYQNTDTREQFSFADYVVPWENITIFIRRLRRQNSKRDTNARVLTIQSSRRLLIPNPNCIMDLFRSYVLLLARTSEFLSHISCFLSRSFLT